MGRQVAQRSAVDLKRRDMQTPQYVGATLQVYMLCVDEGLSGQKSDPGP
jgi:hypothetical protein